MKDDANNKIRVLITAEDRTETRCTLGEFLADNAAGLDDGEVTKIRTAVLSGACYTGGGGAGLMFDIEIDPAPIYESADDLIAAELRHLPFAVHLDIKKAFEAGKRAALAKRDDRVFGEPSDEEFVPRDHNDADGVTTMRDLA